MKPITILLAGLCALACTAQTGTQTLTQWTLQQEGGDVIYNVTVPSTVAGALNEAGALGENLLEELRYFDADKGRYDSTWVYTTRFKAGKGCHVLRFKGLGYSADIFLNGMQIAKADTTLGVFAVREWDVTGLTKESNTLEVRVHQAPRGCLNHGFVDWNPHPLGETMGLIAPVELISTPNVEVKDVFVRPELSEDLSQASFTVYTTLVNRSSKPVSGQLKGRYEGGSFGQAVSLKPGETVVMEHREQVENPRIWWPYDMGTPELYHLTMGFDKAHSKDVAFGLRTVSSEIDSLGHRQFLVNGRKILFKAGGWTDDIFMQDTPESIRKQLELVKNMGLNGIRFENIWGKDDTVYDLCDQMGILALVGWSCLWEWPNYSGLPGNKYGCINGPEVEALAVRYFHDQLLRMRNHASLIGWLTGSDMLPNPTVEAEYLKLYGELEYRPYICSAAGLTSTLSGPSGMKMMGPYEYVGPDYWYVDTTHGGAYGFNTETGIGMNIPQEEDVRRIVGEEHLWPTDNAFWSRHCTKSSHMNNTEVMLEVIAGEYGEASGFEDFVRKAQAVDYDGTRAMFEAFRCHIDHATGIVQWMLNSAWPALYWQLYSWYLNPTAGYYGTQKACAPYQLIYNYGEHAVYAVNDTRPEERFDATLRIYDAQSKLIRKDEKPATFAPRTPVKVFEGIEGPCFVDLELKKGKEVVSRNFYCVAQNDNEYDWAAGNWFITPIRKYADLSFVTALPQAKLELQARKADDGFRLTLTNHSEVIAYQNILKALDKKGQLIPAALWSDNFFALVPGESRTVLCRLPEGVKDVDWGFSGWNGVL